ncbi:hypothetical protein CAE01nite_30490 [Cellulomonas aerilata]|uniref:Uncharacterized protein n=1 Tax=Cellulomonas aerilata TaxID=515326 RepID=A0A512DFQ6_9CELL|nr:hypothetical protein CAE01nite_30490 [Cellulomonas aerilata]
MDPMLVLALHHHRAAELQEAARRSERRRAAAASPCGATAPDRSTGIRAAVARRRGDHRAPWRHLRAVRSAPCAPCV